MKNFKVKHLLFICSILAMIFVFGCSKKKEAGGASLLYGENSKRWHAEKEKDASGDKVKQSNEDKSAVMQFFANGNYSMTSNMQNSAGTYSYDQAGRSITLTPTGSATSMSFEVTKLDDDELDLKAPDGSTMELEAD